jgi:hypothetical protein
MGMTIRILPGGRYPSRHLIYCFFQPEPFEKSPYHPFVKGGKCLASLENSPFEKWGFRGFSIRLYKPGVTLFLLRVISSDFFGQLLQLFP